MQWRRRLAGLVLGMTMAAPGFTQGVNELPPQVAGVDIVDRSGASVPRDLVFMDEAGETVRLAEFLDQGRPVLLQLVYYNCPMLCTLVLNGYLDAARELDWTPGTEYEVVTVSFDPRDTAELAAGKKDSHVAAFGRPEAANGWHFLTGEEASVRALADSVGFRYRWLPEQKDFAHGAGMFVLTPEGRISRTLYGIEFSPRDLRLSLTEASEGRLGSPFDKLLLYCFSYDPETHKYAMVARNVMRLGGLLTVVALGSLLMVLWRRDRQRMAAA